MVHRGFILMTGDPLTYTGLLTIGQNVLFVQLYENFLSASAVLNDNVLLCAFVEVCMLNA